MSEKTYEDLVRAILTIVSAVVSIFKFFKKGGDK